MFILFGDRLILSCLKTTASLINFIQIVLGSNMDELFEKVLGESHFKKCLTSQSQDAYIIRRLEAKCSEIHSHDEILAFV